MFSAFSQDFLRLIAPTVIFLCWHPTRRPLFLYCNNYTHLVYYLKISLLPLGLWKLHNFAQVLMSWNITVVLEVFDIFCSQKILTFMNIFKTRKRLLENNFNADWSQLTLWLYLSFVSIMHFCVLSNSVLSNPFK